MSWVGRLKLSVVETLQGAKVVATSAAADRHTAKRRRKPIVPGTQRLTLHGGKRERLFVSLNRAGKKFLASRRKLAVGLAVTQRGHKPIARKLTLHS